ncbi:tau-tubulin kinase homolog Asator-like [Anastrepha obliqua]|uniref:tau-tubulin kinase homolog Asator-like n=1 Tax=Anastrepha obliqua TaxID=95512 RepID=UPI00240A3922|nr:tau-tubulin kinase homolog Asator-like [Anastrepha obliqua]
MAKNMMKALEPFRGLDITESTGCGNGTPPTERGKCTKTSTRKKYNLNIVGIDNCSILRDSIPRCWSEPAIGNVLRRDLEPPIIQQAAFDNTVYRMDISRNICVREIHSATAALSATFMAVTPNKPASYYCDDGNTSKTMNEAKRYNAVYLAKIHSSLPNMSFLDNQREMEDDFPIPDFKVLPWRMEANAVQRSTLSSCNHRCQSYQQSVPEPFQNVHSLPVGTSSFSNELTQGEGCVNGRLEIRVIPRENSHAEESSYYDALGAAVTMGKDTTVVNTVAPVNDEDACSDEKEVSPLQRNQTFQRSTKTTPLDTPIMSKAKSNRNDISVAEQGEELSVFIVPQTCDYINGKTEVERISTVVRSNEISVSDTEACGGSRAGFGDGIYVDGASSALSNIVPGFVGVLASKIPILNSRQSKCASWSGSDMTLQMIGSTPCPAANHQAQAKSNKRNLNNNTKKSIEDVSVVSIFQTPNMTDLTPALRRRRESDKHVTDPCQLSLRFARPRSRHAIRTRGIPTFLLGHFEDQSLDNSEEFQAQSHTGKINEHNSKTNIRTSNSSNRHHSQRRIQKQDTTPLLHNEEELLCTTVAELKSSENTINNDITPPPV